MRQTGCLPAAFVIVALLAVLGLGAVQQENYRYGLNLNLKVVTLVAVPLMLATIGALAFVKLRRRHR